MPEPRSPTQAMAEELQRLCRQLDAAGRRAPWPVAQAYGLHRSTARLAKAVLRLAQTQAQGSKASRYQSALAAARAAELLLDRPLERHWLSRQRQRHLRRDLAGLTALLLRVVAALKS
jgi:hypothetical protein